MSRLSSFVAILLCLLAPYVCSAKTPWGEKDISDTLREARAYHIMFLSERDAVQAKARLAAFGARDLLSAFQRIARAESKDPGSAVAGGDLGVVQEGVMVRSFEEALFSLAPRTVSEPVKSEFGWHLIYAFDFKETSVQKICADSLLYAALRTPGYEQKLLARSDSMVGAPDYALSVSQILGEEWGPPLMDTDGDLTFFQIVPASGQALPTKALVHTEYTKPVLSKSPLACRRSVRKEFEINCDARLALPVVRAEYEGRGASGRVLLQWRISADDRDRFASGTGFHGQLLASACKR
jgi:PPIC-type PPIASE domain